MYKYIRSRQGPHQYSSRLLITNTQDKSKIHAAGLQIQNNQNNTEKDEAKMGTCHTSFQSDSRAVVVKTAGWQDRKESSGEEQSMQN